MMVQNYRCVEIVRRGFLTALPRTRRIDRNSKNSHGHIKGQRYRTYLCIFLLYFLLMEHDGWLAHLPAKELFAHTKPIVTCEKTETVEAVLRKLATHNLYSLPIVDQTGSPLGLVCAGRSVCVMI